MSTSRSLYKALIEMVGPRPLGTSREAAVNLLATLLIAGAEDWEVVEARLERVRVTLAEITESQWEKQQCATMRGRKRKALN